MRRILFYLLKYVKYKIIIKLSPVISIFLIVFFNQTTALPQNADNAVVFAIAPGISTTLDSKPSDFDNNYFYTLSPHLGVTIELLYQQVLNKLISLNSGFGLSFNNYEFYHYNFNSAYNDEMESKEIASMAYKIPLFVKYKLQIPRLKWDLFSTFGSEIIVIHAYGESIHFGGGSYGGGGNIDSTIYAEYESYSPNANLRLGVEVNNLFDTRNLNLNATLAYQLLPYGQISVTNTVYESGSERVYKGTLFPKLITFYFGIHIPVFTDI